MLSSLKRLTAFLYDLIISRFLTITAHIAMLPHMTQLTGSLLDVGSGTGAPLEAIYGSLRGTYRSIVGVDMHHEYTLQAQKRFQGRSDVQIHEMNFYDLGKNIKSKFEFILFSFSFMLMPDQVEAINVAKNSL